MKKSFFINQSCFFLASGCYSGLLPVMPGTWASFFAILILFFSPEVSVFTYLGFLALFFFIGIGIVSCVLKNSRDHDPAWIVIDEFWGMGISVIALPKTVITYAVAFLLFRLFDVKKIFLVDRAQRAPGAWGVMLDDGVAGILALTGAHVFCYFFY